MNYTPWVLIVALLAVGATIVLQAIMLAHVDTCSCTTADGAALTVNISTHTPTPAVATACRAPPAYHTAAYAHTWFVLGDEFARGDGVAANDYLSLMKAQSRRLNNVDPLVINAVGADNVDNLPQQIALVKQSVAYRSLVESTRPALVIVSYGAGLLQRQADRGAQDAALSIVMDHYAALWSDANESLIPPGRASQFYVVLVPHPDPTYGGVSIPAACASCASLNHPTLSSRIAHREIYSSLALFLRNTATRNQWAWLDSDQAFGAHAWPSATNCESSAFNDCYTYNAFGHAQLAATLWQCITNGN